MLEIHRTHQVNICNHSQVADALDQHGWSASKLWNVAIYHTRQQWDETGEIPDHQELKHELKDHPKYKGLHSQSSQKVLEELSEAYSSWINSDDDRDNPPGYRKENYYDAEGRRVHEEHPRSTVTWKQNGFRHDFENNRIRLSKGANHKEHPRAWEYILVEYETRPDVTVENIQQVRAVYDTTREQWELHLVCEDEIETPAAPGSETAGIDLGISNFAAVAYSTDDAELYPGNRLKQDGYYFPKEIAHCDDSGGNRATRLHRTWTERRTHFFHSLATHIVEQCVEHSVGRINIGNLSGIREDDETGAARNWGRHGNLDLHGWAFDRFTKILTYKAKANGIEVVEVDESGTSTTCCRCGKTAEKQRVERGLYVCEECDAAFNADVNGAENIRLDMNESNSESQPAVGGDRSIGCLAQPAVYLYDLSSGFQPQAQVVDCKP